MRSLLCYPLRCIEISPCRTNSAYFAPWTNWGALTCLHICGNITHFLPDVITSGADMIDLDWMVDLRAAADIFGDQASPVGNFDPVSVGWAEPNLRAHQAKRSKMGGLGRHYSTTSRLSSSKTKISWAVIIISSCRLRPFSVSGS
jgi:hypothetical protein